MHVTKRRKDEGSTPAGVPHLQEVGFTGEGENADAKSFIETRNRICGPVIINKKGI